MNDELPDQDQDRAGQANRPARLTRLAALKPTAHMLLVFAPGEWHSPCATFEACAPFHPIARGDLLCPMSWDTQGPGRRMGWCNNSLAEEYRAKAFRVLAVDHLLYDLPECVRHVVRLFTEAVPDRAELRTGGR